MNTSKKKIALIRPYYKEYLRQLSFPIGLGYLAQSMRNQGFIVQIYDLNILHISNYEFVKYLEKLHFDFIGVTALTFYYEAMIEICNLIKKNNYLNKIPIIIGGVHVTALPEQSLRETFADYAVLGEGEIKLKNLIESLLKNEDISRINGIAYFLDKKFYQTATSELIPNLDSIPKPAWDLLHPERYPKTPHGFVYRNFPVFPIFSSRGCPFSCTYCASRKFWCQTIRYHSISRVIDEIEFLVNNYGAKEIHIWDDNFTLNKERVLEFCHEIRKRKLNLTFACPNGVQINSLDFKLLREMRSVGFYSLIFAIESGSKKILREIHKSVHLEKLPSLLTEAKHLGYFSRAFFIINLPSETNKDLHKTIELACKLPLDYANFFIFNPLPGSEFYYEWIQKKGTIIKNWNFDYFHNPQNMEGFNQIDQRNIIKIQRYCYIKFLLLNPMRLFSYILQIKPNQFPLIIDRIRFFFN